MTYNALIGTLNPTYSLDLLILCIIVLGTVMINPPVEVVAGRSCD